MKRPLLCLLMLFASAVQAQEPPKFATGLKVPADIKARHKASWALHGKRLMAVPIVSASSYDCRALGLVPPVKDQGSCGSCWNFSGSGAVTAALLKSGHGKADGGFGASEQYVMDCGDNGGCNGDWPESVLEMAKRKGLPIEKDYGPYRATSGNCKNTSGMKFYAILDYGYVGREDAVPSTQAIKDAMVAHGPLAVAVAADNAFMNYQGGVFAGRGAGINHAVMLVGWDDSKGRSGAWLMRNSWGKDWGVEGGYMWIEYGANQIGYGAMWASATPLPPPPDPPVPPIPPPGAATITLSKDMKAGTYQIGGGGINKDTTIGQLLDLIVTGQAAPPLPPVVNRDDERIERLEKQFADLKHDQQIIIDSLLKLQATIRGDAKEKK